MTKEKDIKRSKEFTKKMKKMGWREIPRSEAPNPKKPTSPNDIKSRITIYLDADIVSFYKEQAGENGKGYQTLINQTLRKIVDEKREEEKTAEIKREILEDKEFLEDLKEALTT